MEYCRVCMITSQNLCSLSEIFRESFFSITGVKLFSDAEEYLCESCLGRLMYAQKFRDEALRADIWFKEQRENVLTNEEVQYLYENDELEEAGDVEYLIEDSLEDFGNADNQVLEEISRVDEEKIGFSCNFCPNSTFFTTKNDLEIHMMAFHSFGSPLQCSFCGKSFTKPAQYAIHLRTHITKHQRNPAPGKAKFTKDSVKSKHFKVAHDISKKPFACNECNESFYVAVDLKIHEMTKHTKQETRNKRKCSICEKEFTYPSNLKQHMASHLGEKTFACKVCEKSYFKSSSLRRHYQSSHSTVFQQMVANGEVRRVRIRKTVTQKKRRHKCFKPDCHESFDLAGQLQTHLETKHKVMYQCDDCDSAFKNIKKFRAHRKKVHNPKGPRACNECQKVFEYPSLLRNHVLIVHRGLIFSCELCTRSFSCHSHLLRHYRELHTDFYEQNVREGKFRTRKTRKMM